MAWSAYVGALALHICCATLVLRRQALRVCAWDIPALPALAGQLVISLGGLLAALACVALVSELGLPGSTGLHLLGLFTLLVAWGLALSSLVAWLAQRAEGSFYSPATMRRITRRGFFHVIAWYGAAALLAAACWRIGALPDMTDFSGNDTYPARATAAHLQAKPVPTSHMTQAEATLLLMR